MASEILASPLGTTNMPNFNDRQPITFFSWSFLLTLNDFRHLQSGSTGAFSDITKGEERPLFYKDPDSESEGFSRTPETPSWENTFLD